MATTVRITFTGLCYFDSYETDAGKRGVKVSLVDASQEVQHCGETLDMVHQARLIAEARYLGESGEKKQREIAGLKATISAKPAGNLDVPTHLASVSQLGGASTANGPRPDRVLAEFRLEGGLFGVMSRKAPTSLSSGWVQGTLRWQDTWVGKIDEDELSFQTDSGTHTLRAVDGMIDLVIVNLMPKDVGEWARPDDVALPTGSWQDAEDFRWFFWMFGWENTNCDGQTVPEQENKSLGRAGLPYTCVGGGS